MNEKNKKKDKNIKTFSIDEKDNKYFVEPSVMKSIDIDSKENNNRKSSINVKMKKIPEDINNPINAGQISKFNRSFSIDMNRKADGMNFFNALTNNNALKLKDNINHGVIKLYSFSPVKSSTIEVSKEKKIRNTSVNRQSGKANFKKSPKRKNQSQNGIQPVITSVITKHSNGIITANKEYNINSSNKKNKSQNSNNNTPVSLNIVNTSEINNVNSSNYFLKKKIKRLRTTMI